MTTEIVTITPPSGVPAAVRAPGVSAETLLRSFLSGKARHTIKAYRGGLLHFARFLGSEDPLAGVRALVVLPRGAALSVAMAYKARMMEAGVSANTINLRLAAVRNVVRLAHSFGMVDWLLDDLENVRAAAYRDTRGPGVDAFRRMLAQVEGDDARARRDRAVLRLLFDLALRRGKLSNIDVADVDLTARSESPHGTVAVVAKGQTQRRAKTLPRPTAAALRAWLEVRPAVAAPDEPALFVGLQDGRRLIGTAVWKLVHRYGERAGVRAWPHGLRHSSITTALDRTNGDVRAVQKFADHANANTTLIYDDNRKDLAGRVAGLIADDDE